MEALKTVLKTEEHPQRQWELHLLIWGLSRYPKHLLQILWAEALQHHPNLRPHYLQWLSTYRPPTTTDFSLPREVPRQWGKTYLTSRNCLSNLYRERNITPVRHPLLG